ncbi:MAG TPA: type II toxin-antitoxin system VapC family toxin [Chloroflexota bacterium]|nr:type II toxin-antitoxin system VapC family toxin [Chloroflexota bacterium]
MYYLDSSALVKLAVREAETAALRRFLRSRPARVTSALATVEVLRTVRRYTTEGRAERAAERVLAGTTRLALDEDILAAAARMTPAALRSLDAIHLAAALSLGRDLAGLVTYDERLAEAALEAGVPVHTPR